MKQVRRIMAVLRKHMKQVRGIEAVLRKHLKQKGGLWLCLGSTWNR
jgi:hypothetical protein